MLDMAPGLPALAYWYRHIEWRAALDDYLVVLGITPSYTYYFYSSLLTINTIL